MQPGQRGVIAATALALASACRGGPEPAAARGPTVPFPAATVHLEQNATDGDVEVVFQAVARAAGLTTLTITAPDGRRVVALAAPDTSTLGLRQFRFESPEPRDPRRILAAYPEGPYTFVGTTAAGDSLTGSGTLSHRLPPSAAVTYPADEAEGVRVSGLVIRWALVAGIAAHELILEGPGPGRTLTVRLPASATSFQVPDGVLRPGQEYQLAIGTVLAGGNTAFVETTFTTNKE